MGRAARGLGAAVAAGWFLLAAAPAVAAPAGDMPAGTTGGVVLGWGSDVAGQVGDGHDGTVHTTPVKAVGLALEQVVKLESGQGHNLAITTDGSVLSWGANFDGQLGNGARVFPRLTPAPVLGLGPGSEVVDVAAGHGHSLALRADGSVLAWGSNDEHELGDGTDEQAQLSPVPVSGLGPGSGVIDVDADYGKSIALKADGSVLIWGRGFGLAFDTTVPMVKPGLGPGSNIIDVAVGATHNVAIRRDGTVLAWGNDEFGQLGDGDGPAPPQDVLVPVAGLGPGSGVIAVDATIAYTLALRTDGSVVSWGTGPIGTYGDEVAASSTPVVVPGLRPGSGAIAVSAGFSFALALQDDGGVVTWGTDDFGQLGDAVDAPNALRAAAGPVSGLGAGSGVIAAAAGGAHGLALTTGAQGHALVAADGGVFSSGTAGFFGSTGWQRLTRPVVAIEYTPTGRGYWLAAADGGVFPYGDASFLGAMAGRRLQQPIVGIERTATGDGYWLVAADGGVFAFGDARFRGSTADVTLNRPIVGMEPTPKGDGYWLVASDGGIFTFGTAPFYGSTGGMPLNRPAVAMARSQTGHGYHLVAADGGVFAFGNAPFLGSATASTHGGPVTGIMPTPDGEGYWLCAATGGVHSFGNAQSFGSLDMVALNAPVVGCDASLNLSG